MSTLVTFHAHPDDEAIATGGTMARAAAAGHRVVLVVATRGEHGEVVDGYLDPGEQLWERRVKETAAAAAILGVSRVEFLGYVDSGMMGTPENDAPDCFWQADVEEAATRLAAILADEGADVVTAYDENGAYGHPDHIQVHRVGVRAAEQAGIATVYEATVDREYLHFVETHLVVEAGRSHSADLGLAATSLGLPTVLVTCTIDVRSVLAVKRAAMEAHASQIPETSSAMRLPSAGFTAVYGFEWFGRRGPSGPLDELPQM